jgi:lipopolysaccharide export system protein LptA
VPGHDQTDVPPRRLASTWLLLLAIPVVSATWAWTSLGQDAPVATWKGDEGEIIRLKADRVHTWHENGVLWAVLEDQVEVGQGDVSLRSDRAVARIVRAGRAGGSIYRVELYAEGSVHDPANPGQVLRDVRTLLVTRKVYGLEARVKGGRHSSPTPPRGLPLLARAFPDSAEPPSAKASANLKLQAAQAANSRPSMKPIETSTSLPAQGLSATSRLPPPPTSEPVATATPAGPGLEVLPFGALTEPAAKEDPAVRQVQNPPPDPAPANPAPGFPDDFSAQPVPDPVPPVDQTPLAPNSVPLGPSPLPPIFDGPPPNIEALPDGAPAPPPRFDPNAPLAPVLTDSQRITQIIPRGLGEIYFETLPTQPDGTEIIIVRNGVNILMRSKEQGLVDIEADSVVIWRRKEGRLGPARIDYNGQLIDNSSDPLEFYLEGHVILRQDQLKYQGKSDQRTYQGERIYFDVRKGQLLALNAQVELFAPNLVTPMKIKSPRILQYHPVEIGPDGQPHLSTLTAMQAEKTISTGSRFANPGYRFTSRSMDVTQVIDNRVLEDADRKTPYDRDDLTWLIDARQNFFFVGPIPVFYLPRFTVEADDLNPPLQGITFATNNYFGQQFRTDWDMFNLLARRHPPEIDVWNLDVDYLSARDKTAGQGIALGTEIGWYGADLINDINDPWHKKKLTPPSRLNNYAGYFDVYGLFDGSRDVLGGGPAIITDSPNNNQDGRAGYTRLSNPFYHEFRGIVTMRHMQSLVNKDTPLDQDFRINTEIGFFSDRNFLEQYFKRRFDTGLDQENLTYVINQKQNVAMTLLAETNLQTFNTETQWYPKGDYYRLGDSLLGNRLTYYQHTGADYANVHTAAEVNNKTIFAYLPIDPISNTKGTFESGRLYTAHELDLPLNFQFFRITPYVQGQAVGWNNQIAGHAIGRIWGGAGAKADVLIWKAFPNVDSELFNVHGLNHKIDFVADFRDAYSNVPINSLGVQDDLDDNAYEYSRRYFTLTNYIGGVLPAQYDPRALLLRRALSPITGTTDIQASIETLKLGIHQRLQTKRGQEGKRHINDYVIFDLDTTYFPNAARDNFNKPFGQNTYNFEWYIGDRTSILSYGWFEFWKVGGDPYLAYNTSLDRNDPFGLHIITSGISITRIPRGNIFIGYSIVNTGPINTSALNTQYSYWISPKWFGTVSESYDFGNGILLAASGALTRIGADYLTSIGLTVSPLQHSYQFTVSISPRLSPNMQFGSSSGVTRLDSRFAPVE